MTTDDKDLVERLRKFEALLVDYADMLEKADDIGLNVLGNDIREVASALDPAADRIEQLSSALREAAADFRTIQELNSHGACDKTYIDWLRANAKDGERKALSALQSLQVGGE